MSEETKNMVAEFTLDDNTWIACHPTARTWENASSIARQWNGKFGDKTRIINEDTGEVGFVLPAKIAILETNFKVEALEKFPENANPYVHDSFHMGTRIGANCVVMMANHSNEKTEYLIIVNTETGERLRVNF